jgi:thiol-disulfide isomerase/thioredoxin
MTQIETRPDGLKRRFLALAGLLAIVGAAVGGLSLAGLLGGQGAGEGILAAELRDTPRPATGERFEVGVEKGKFAPDFEVSDLDGERVRLSDFRGQAVIVNFWATWCLFCAREMPDLYQLKLNHDSDLAIIAVNRRESADSARRYLSNVERIDGVKGVAFDVNGLDPDDTLYEAYRALGMPASFFVNPDGVITHVANGPILLKQMEEALLDTLEPAGG